MKNNNAVLKILKLYQEKEKMLVPEMYASFAIALHETGKTKEEIVEILEFTQALWEQYANGEIDMIKWAEEITGLNLHDFNTNKAKAGVNNDD